MTGRSGVTLPPVPYVPGRTPRPEASLFEPLKSGLRTGLTSAQLAGSAAFLGGQEAFARGYFWEAHELWEAVWICLPPASAERHLLTGLIQLANAGLKLAMGRGRASQRIFALADRALREAFLNGQDTVMDISWAEVCAMRSRLAGEGADGRGA